MGGGGGPDSISSCGSGSGSIVSENLIQLSDFVGEHGPYQMLMTLLLFLRYVLLGLMANSGPLMTPDVTHYCSLPMDEIVAIMPNITLLNKTEQEIEIKEEFKRICQIDLHLYQQAYLNYSIKQQQIEQVELMNSRNKQNKSFFNININNNNEQQQQQQQQPKMFNGHKKHLFNESDKIRECTDFTYDLEPELGRTMTNEFDLVCDRDWLRSIFQSIISGSIVIAHVFWGTFSDKYGRFTAQKYCLTISLLAGSLSILTIDFWTFTILRALTSFGDLGLAVSLTTTVVELVGNKYRGISVAWVNFGSALGVTISPYVVAYFQDFKLVIIFTVICNLLTLPFFLFTTNESIRWLLTNRKFHSAKKELKRLIRSNKRYYRLLSILFWPLKSRGYFKPNIIGFNKVVDQSNTNANKSNLNSNTNSNDDKAVDDDNNNKIREEENRKISWFEEKQAFEIMFKRFIDQIESQNFCDPLGPTLTQLESPSVTSAFSPEPSTEQTDVLLMAAATSGNQSGRVNNLDLNKLNTTLAIINKNYDLQTCSSLNNNNISRTPAASSMQEINADLQVEDINKKLAETGRPSISCVPLNNDNSFNQEEVIAGMENNNSSSSMEKINKLEEKIEIFDLPEIFIENYEENIIDNNENLPAAAEAENSIKENDNRISSSGSESSVVELNWTHLKAPYSRSDSCGHLEKNINQKRCHFLLTIPANDPNNMLNISQDFRDAHFVRRRRRRGAHNHQPDCINMVASQLNFMGRVNRVFKDKQLMLVVFTIVWTTFNSELQYTSFIIINMEVGEDVKWNYFLGGCMEFSAAIIASLLLSIASRRNSLIIFWLLISIFCFGLSIAHIDSHWAVLLLALAKFSQSCLSSIASVAAFESFPTFLRQSGSGLVSTLGMLGSVFAPLIFAEFDDHAGMDRVLMTFSLSSLTAAILIFLYLKETKNCELN